MSSTELTDTLVIKLMSLAVHAEEYIEAGHEPLDAGAIQGLLADPEVVEARAYLSGLALLPVKRSDD